MLLGYFDRIGKFPVIVLGPSFRVGNQLSQSQGPGWGEKAGKVLPGRPPATSLSTTLPSCKHLRLPGVDARRAVQPRADLVQAATPVLSLPGVEIPGYSEVRGRRALAPRPLARIWVKSAAGEN